MGQGVALLRLGQINTEDTETTENGGAAAMAEESAIMRSPSMTLREGAGDGV